MIVAQISDPHLREQRQPMGPIDTAACLEQAVATLNRFSPAIDAVLLSGDIGNDGTVGEYELARDILGGLDMPFFLIPGNHDRREPLRQVFAGLCPLAEDSGFVQFSLEWGALRLLALDTLVEGQSQGGLCGERLDWLEARLEEAMDRPVLLMMHHPPVACGIAAMDRIRLIEGAARFEQLVARHPRIERILTGHVHRSIIRRLAGTVVQVCPGIAHQMRLDLDPKEPLAFTAEPPGFLLHQIDDDGTITTHNCIIGHFGEATTYASLFG